MVAEMWLYEVGVVLVVVGAVASGYGFNLIKRSSLQEADLPFYKRRLLLAGLLLSSVVSSVLDVVSYAIVPLAVIAPLSGVSILSATFFASIGLGGAKERITPLKTLGVALVVSGIVIVAIVGPRPADDLEDLNEAFEGYTSTPFLVYQIVACAALAAIFTSLAAGILPLYSISRVVLCALSAGLASGLCQALIKLLATCFFEAVMHEAQPWQNPLFAIAIVQLVITGLLLFALVKTTIEASELSLGSSLYTVFVIGSTILSGAAFYKDFAAFTLVSALVFAIGVASVIVGIVVLWRQRRLDALPVKIKQSEEPVEILE